MAEWIDGKWCCGAQRRGMPGVKCHDEPLPGFNRCRLHGAHSGRPHIDGSPPKGRPADFKNTFDRGRPRPLPKEEYHRLRALGLTIRQIHAGIRDVG